MPTTTTNKDTTKALADASDFLATVMLANITAAETGDTTMLNGILESLPPPTLYRYYPNPSFSPEGKQKLRERIQALADYSTSLIKKDASVDPIAAGNSGLILAEKLLEVLAEDDTRGVEHSDFEQVLKQGYQDMSDNRRLGYFHSFFIAISSVLRSIEDFICPGMDTKRNASVKIGEISFGFFGRTARQELVMNIHKAFNEVVNPPASNDSELSNSKL